MRRAALALALACGCGGAELAGDGRAKYDEAVVALAKSDWEPAEKGFLAARDDAGQDQELRFAAAYDLGLAYAGQADGLRAQQPDKALDLLHQSAAWFRDAVKLRPADGDARKNLEVALRRAQALNDELNQDQKRLEARLDRLIDDQRSLRDKLRGVMTEVAGAGAGADPTAFRGEYEDLATLERTLLAEAGAIADVASDEQAVVRAKPEAQRSQTEQVRLAQLDGLGHYLELARGGLAETRLALRRLEGGAAGQRSDEALAALKRAREQLMDPVEVLGRVASDELELARQTALLAELGKGKLTLTGGGPATAPPWLAPPLLVALQDDARARTSEIADRFAGAVSQPPPPPDPKAPPPDPKQARALAAAREALPAIYQAMAAMDAAKAALGGDQLPPALGKEGEAIDALGRAIERFSDLKHLIELAHAQQDDVIALLTPDDKAELTTAERQQRLTDGVGRNVERLGRMEAMLAEQRAEALAKVAPPAAGSPAQPGQPAPDPKAAEQAKAQVEALYDEAERQRKTALDALTDLATQLAAAKQGAAAARAKATAETAQQHLEELRRLFFTLVEHLKELARQQGETGDATATAAAGDDAARARTLPPLADAEDAHTQLAGQLAAAIEKQADAARAATDGKAKQQGETLAKAATEVRAAETAMKQADEVLAKARDLAANPKLDLAPALKAEPEALEHLANAIKLLEPPQDDKKQDKQQQQQQQQDKQQGKDKQGKDPQPQPAKPDEQNLSQQQAERRLQEIRDRDAERKKQHDKQPATQPEPVDKDW